MNKEDGRLKSNVGRFEGAAQGARLAARTIGRNRGGSSADVECENLARAGEGRGSSLKTGYLIGVTNESYRVNPIAPHSWIGGKISFRQKRREVE